MKTRIASSFRRFFPRLATDYDVIESMLKAHADQIKDSKNSEEDSLKSQYFVSRLMRRINERREGAELNRWENSVLAARGWLIAFGIVACAMLVLNIATSSSSLSHPPNDIGIEVLALAPPDTSDGTIQALENLHVEELGNGRKY